MAIAYNANYIETMPFSDVCAQFNLATGVAQTWTIPGTNNDVYQAYFSYAQQSNVFVRKNGTAASPSSGTMTSAQYNEFKPKKRYVRGGETLSFVSPDATGAYTGVSLRQVQSS